MEDLNGSLEHVGGGLVMSAIKHTKTQKEDMLRWFGGAGERMCVPPKRSFVHFAANDSRITKIEPSPLDPDLKISSIIKEALWQVRRWDSFGRGSHTRRRAARECAAPV